MPKRATPETRLADAALKLLAKNRWADISLAQIAKSAKIPLSELAAIAPAKPALIGFILQRIGEKVSHTYRSGSAATHERLFDVGMAWFDAIAPHKKAIGSLYQGLKKDPLTLISVRGSLVEAA